MNDKTDMFFCTVSSGSATSLGTYNDFTVNLAQPLRLKGHWRVMLRSALFPALFNNPDPTKAYIPHSTIVSLSILEPVNVGARSIQAAAVFMTPLGQYQNTSPSSQQDVEYIYYESQTEPAMWSQVITEQSKEEGQLINTLRVILQAANFDTAIYPPNPGPFAYFSTFTFVFQRVA